MPLGKKKFYDTNAVLKLQSKIFEDDRLIPNAARDFAGGGLFGDFL